MWIPCATQRCTDRGGVACSGTCPAHRSTGRGRLAVARSRSTRRGSTGPTRRGRPGDPTDRRRREARNVPWGRRRERREVVDVRGDVDRSGDALRIRRRAAVRQELYRDHVRHRVIAEGRERTFAEWIAIAAAHALSEGTCPQPLMTWPSNWCSWMCFPLLTTGRTWPIPEATARGPADGDRVAMTANDDARLDCVNGRAVAGGDVDAEVKRGELTLGIEMEPRIAERSANRVRLMERLHGPAVRERDVRDRQRECEHEK